MNSGSVAGPELPDVVSALARAVASGAVTLDGGEPLEELVESMVAVPGISSAGAHHIALRLGARDAFPGTDPTVGRELQRLGASINDLDEVSQSWRPWRALATIHLLAQGRD